MVTFPDLPRLLLSSLALFIMTPFPWAPHLSRALDSKDDLIFFPGSSPSGTSLGLVIPSEFPHLSPCHFDQPRLRSCCFWH